MTPTLRPVVFALAAFATACAGAGPAARPAEVPASFSRSGRAAVPDRWWLAIDDAALHSLIEIGLGDNPGLRATWDRLAQAEAAARREGATALPTVSGDAGASASIRPEGTSSSLSLGLAASYEVDLWGGIDAAREAAALDARASAADLEAAAITLSAAIASSWYQLVEQRRQAALLERQRQLRARTLSLVELRQSHGLIAETDVLRQRQQLEALRGDASQAASRVAVLENQLAILLGRPPGAPVPGAAAIPPLPPLPSTGVPGELVQRRPDIVRGYLRIQAADHRVAAAIADKFPRLSFSLKLSSGIDPLSLFSSWLGSLAAGLAQPIVDGGRRDAAVDAARAQLSERIHVYEGEVLAALGEVEDALVRELHQRDFIRSLDEQAALARGVHQRAVEAYAAGAADYLRVLDAEESLQGLERRRLAAEHELVELRIALYRALAGGFDLEKPAA